MKPTSRKSVLLLVVLCVLGAGGFAAWYFFLRPKLPDFATVGGTILVYELDERGEEKDADLNLLAQVVQRRLEEGGIPHATVRAAGEKRVEIRVPRTEAHAGELAAIKELLSRVGSLEFRILANEHDDTLAIEAARALIDNPVNRAALQEWQLKGLPPPGPTKDGTALGESRVFELATLPGGQKSRVTYSWVELGPQELMPLGLDHAARFDPERALNWHTLGNKRGRATQLWVGGGRKLAEPGIPGRKEWRGALFYSRECMARNLTEEERRKRQFEYFILARNPEIDPKTGKEKPRLDGRYLTSASRSESGDGRPAVSITLNNTGGELFGELTRKNVPSGAGDEGDQLKRHLAIILDGQVVSAPTINSEIGRHAQLTGQFTEREIEHLVSVLRAGALPVRLKANPVSETTIGPAKGNGAQ